MTSIGLIVPTYLTFCDLAQIQQSQCRRFDLREDLANGLLCENGGVLIT